MVLKKAKKEFCNKDFIAGIREEKERYWTACIIEPDGSRGGELF